MTRWHIDDPGGRLLAHFAEDHTGRIKVLKFPAIAETDEEYREAGAPLFPEHKSIEFLRKQQDLLSRGSWEALWQQNPIIVGGGLFPIDRLKTVRIFDRSQIRASIRSWDKAGSQSEDAAYTAGVLLHATHDGTFVIEHVERGRWGALAREQRILATAARDASLYKSYTVLIEQEPGSGGLESAQSTARGLAGYNVVLDRVVGKGSKETRAEPLACQVQAGNVYLVAGTWQYDLLDEMQSFPNSKYKDQVDAASAAFNYLTLSGKVMLAELRAVKPPLSERVIMDERIAFEEAIRRIENEAAHRTGE